LKLQKALQTKKTNKKDREKRVLIGLIEEYLRTGEPVGSNTLKGVGFDDISSATIRNYFTELEKEGYLKQLHTSGGRIPTPEAYRFYADEFYDAEGVEPEDDRILEVLRKSETKEIALYLQQAAETLSALTNYAVFLSAPRFDHDFIIDLKLVPIDFHRFLCVIVTDFGVIQTELLHTDQKLSSFSVKRIEGYFHWRLSGQDRPENLGEEEEKLAQKFYNELMLRYIVGYSNFIEEEIYRTGFSRLLHYTDFHDTAILANSLSLFENAHSMRLMLRDSSSHGRLKYWIGDDLKPFAAGEQCCSVLSVPYRINKSTVGSVGVLGPIRMPYKKLFGLLNAFSEAVSEALTRNIYKFKITFRQPEPGTPYLQKEEHRLLGQSRLILLEDNRAKKEL
jgi:heat-inducible transcriptional repressor